MAHNRRTSDPAQSPRPPVGRRVHKIVLTLWAVGPLLVFPFALYRAVTTRRIGRKVVATTVVGYLLTGQGITLGFHRLATHEAFKCHRLVKATALVLGSAAAQGPVITWADNHRRHHVHADKAGDPHSPHADFGEGWRESLKGFAHAHLGWLFRDPPADVGRFTKRLREDRLVAFVDRWFGAWVGLGLLIPGLIAGWRGFVWGGLIRMLLVNHATFAVNSVCHMFGSRRFETPDESRNNWFIALITGGEGNHNNHHANAKAAYHGLSWREYDLTGYLIRALAFVGLAWDVHQPTPEEIAARQRQLERQAAKTESEVPGEREPAEPYPPSRPSWLIDRKEANRVGLVVRRRGSGSCRCRHPLSALPRERTQREQERPTGQRAHAPGLPGRTGGRSPRPHERGGSGVAGRQPPKESGRGSAGLRSADR